MIEVVRTIALVEAVLLTLIVVLIFWAVGWRTSRARRLARARDLAAAAIRAAILEEGQTASATSVVRALPGDQQLAALVEAARDLAGEDRARIADIADALGHLARAERDCGDGRWWRRLHAVRVLAVLGRGTRTVPRLLGDTDPLVRAEAAFWAGELRHAASAPALVGIALGDEGLPVFAAQDALIRIGAPALGAIADALRGTADPPRSLMRVVTAVPDPALAGPVAAIAGRETYAERDLAVTALAAIGGPEARTVLVSALADARPAVRAAAAAGIGRMRDWQAAASLARAMTDPAWEVRRAAALALRELDAAGLLYLRSVMTGPDAYAADMARHVLALGARTA